MTVPMTIAEGAAERCLKLADELETEAFADVQPWMIARLIRIAVTNDLSAGMSVVTP